MADAISEIVYDIEINIISRRLSAISSHTFKHEPSSLWHIYDSCLDVSTDRSRPPTIDRDVVNRAWISIRKDGYEDGSWKWESKPARRANEHDWFLFMNSIDHIQSLANMPPTMEKNWNGFWSELLFIIHIVLLRACVCGVRQSIWYLKKKFETILSIKSNYEWSER